MRASKEDFYGDPNIGLFGLVTDSYTIIPRKMKNQEILNKKVIFSQTARTDLNGIFLAGNSNGLLVPNILTDLELKKLKKTSVNVQKLKTNHTALGNLILCNDNGCVISKLLEKEKEKIEKCLNVNVKVGSILDTEIVGSFCVATNKGFLLTTNASEKEFNFIKKCLKVDGDIGSVNFGSPFVKSGILANSNGVLIGNQTTGPEISRIMESLGLLG